jgi:hypothetical protein
VAGTLLVAHENVADAGIEQWVIDGQDCAARQPENGIDALLFQTLDECFGSSELHNVPLLFR